MRYYSSTATDTTLTGNITDSGTSITLASVAGFPTQFPFTLALDYDTASEELVDVTAASGTTLTVTRGVDSTSAQAHSTGAKVKHVISGRDLRETQNHMAGTTGVHGVTGAVVGTTDTQTITNKNLTSATNTFPTSLATLTGTQTLTNKTLTTPVISTIINTGTLTLPTSTDMLVGRATTDTLTNKDLSSSTNTFPASIVGTVAINAQTGTTYTLVAADANAKVVTANNASAITITIPASTFTAGQIINVAQTGVGQVTIAADAGVTANATPGLKLRAQYSVSSILCTSSNTFLVFGDLSA